MGRVVWLVGGAFATAAFLRNWEPLGVAAGMTFAQAGTSVFLGKLPLFDERAARSGVLDSPLSWGRAQFGFLLATFLWEWAFGFAGGEATWTISVAALLVYYALARIGCLQARCCRAPGLRVDSRLVEIGLSMAAFAVLGWSVLFVGASLNLKYVALASLAAIRLWFLLATGQWRQMRFESLGFILTAFAFSVRDHFHGEEIRFSVEL